MRPLRRHEHTSFFQERSLVHAGKTTDDTDARATVDGRVAGGEWLVDAFFGWDTVVEFLRRTMQWYWDQYLERELGSCHPYTRVLRAHLDVAQDPRAFVAERLADVLRR